MRKYLFSALAMGLVLTSCQSDEPFAPGSGEEVQATFTISVPDAMGTRAADHSSAEGGFTNGAGQLNYTVVLLNQDNKVMYSATSTGNGTSATFNPTVVRNYQYKILAYATFGDAAIAAPTVGQTIADTDAINNIATLKTINDESEDAYFCNATIKGEPEMSATLKRPFGKLRLVATDYDKLCDLGLDVKSVKVTYGTTVVMEEKFDAFNKAFEGDGGNVWSADKATYAEAAANELTVFTDYLPALTEGEKMYPFTIEVTYNDNKTVYTRTFAQDIPVKRNYLTTLRGDFFTTEAALTLEVEEMFANAINVNKWDGTTVTPVVEKNGTYAVSTAAELAWIAGVVNGTITRAEGDDFKGKTIVLMEDIDLDNKEWTPIGTEGNPFKGTFDAYGNTIKNLVITGNNSNVGLFGFTTEGEIKNLVVENAKVSGRLNVGVVAGTPYTSKYTNITVKGHVKVNGMAYVGAVGGKNAYANWTNITVNADETSYVNANSVENGVAYRTYVGGVVGFMGEGGHTMRNVTSNIDVKGSTIDVGGIVGIAHYGNNFVNVTCTGDVEIYNASEEAEAQEIGGIAGVWNNGGSNVTFTNCSFDGKLKANNNYTINTNKFGNLVCAAYSADGTGKLIIDGTEYMQTSEGVTINGALVVETAAALQDAIQAGKSDIYLAAGEYTFPAADFQAGQTLVCAEGTVFTGKSGLDINGATVIGATFSNPSGNAVAGNINGTFKNCTFEGSNALRGCYAGETVVFENCEFSGSTYGVHFDGGDNKEITFKNCKLSGFNAFAAALKMVTFEKCTFVGNGKSGYNGANLWGSAKMKDCEFTFDGTTATEWIDCIGAEKTYEFTNCTVNGVAYTPDNYQSIEDIFSRNHTKVTINGVQCQL